MKTLLTYWALNALFSLAKVGAKMTENTHDDTLIEISEKIVLIVQKIRKGDNNVGAECQDIIRLAKKLRLKEKGANNGS